MTFQTGGDFDLPKIIGQDQTKQPPMLCNVTPACIYTYILYIYTPVYATGVSHLMWGDELLGAGLQSLSAFRVNDVIRCTNDAALTGKTLQC